MKLRRWIPAIAVARLVLPVFGGDVLVGGGDLQLSGLLEADLTVIAPGAVLTGDGRIAGDLRVEGDVAPGQGGVGTQTIAGAVAFVSGSRFLCEIAPAAPDRLNATGPVTGTAAVQVFPGLGVIPVGEIIVSGAPASDYAGFSPADAYTWQLTTTGGMDLALTDLRGDTDADGLPDWWEMAHFQNSRTNAAPTGNPDEDPADNLREYGANTDPGDGGSFLRLTDCRQTVANSPVLTWTTAPGRRYAVMRSTNLLAADHATDAVVTAYAQPENVWTGAPETGQSATYWISVQENVP